MRHDPRPRLSFPHDHTNDHPHRKSHDQHLLLGPLSAGALRAARGLGRRVPDDLAAIGFDGLQLGTLVEALTTVALDTRELGALAVEQAGRLLARSGPLSHDEAAVKATLRLRESA
ncbi:substrate-binding domain-containing protein [Streptomyces sp. NPDC002766]